MGVLYSRPGLLDSLDTDCLRTQDQAAPFRIETGTQNHAALAGAGAALRFLAELGEGATLRERLLGAMGAIQAREGRLARMYHDEVRRIPGVKVWGPGFEGGLRAPTVSLTLAGRPADQVARALGRRGVAVWDGHFYAARAVEVLGVPEGGLVRAGMSLYTTEEEV